MNRRPWLLVLPALIFYLALFAVSHIDVLRASLHGKTGLTLDNYRAFFSSAYNLAALRRTVLLSLLTTLVTLLAGYPIAAYLARPDSKLRMPVIFAVVAPMLMSAVARSYGWILLLGPGGILQQLGLKPLLYTSTGMVIALSHVFLPFMVLAVTGSLQQIDPALRRAAEILGAGPVRCFFKVTLPLSVPGILAGVLIVFCLSASAFVTPALVGGATIPMMSYVIYDQALMLLNWNTAATAAVVLLAATALAALLLAWGGRAWPRHSRVAR